MYAWVVRVGTCSVPRLAGVSATWPPLRSKTAADVLRERSSLVNCWERMRARSAAAGRLALALRKAVKTALYSLARDRKSVVLGKSVDLGGRRIIKKNK